MRFRIAAVAVVTAIAGPARAEPPTLVVRLKPAAELLPLAPLVGKLTDREAEAAAFSALATFSTSAKSGLRGLDPSKPSAVYLTPTDGPLGASGALMLPVKDPAAFESALPALAGITVLPEKAGVRELRSPRSQLPGYLRYSRGYAYLTVLSPTFLDDAHLAPPEAVFAEPLTATADLTLRAGQLTPAMVAAAFAQLELAALDAPPPPGRSELDAALDKLTREMPRVLAKRALEQSQSIRAELTLDPKAGRATAVATLAPKPATQLFAEVAGWAGNRGVPFAADRPGQVARSVVGVHLGFSDDAKPYWANAVKAWLAAQLAKPRPHALRTGLALRGLAGAAGIGRLDLDGALLPAIDPPEVFSEAVVKIPAGAVALEALLERSSRELALLTPGFAAELVPFGRGRALKLTRGGGGVPTASAPRGGRLHLAHGPDPLPTLAALVERKPSPCPAATADVSVVELAPLVEPTWGGGKLATAAVFGPEGHAGRDRLTVLLTGGATATLTLVADARAVQAVVRASRTGAAPGPPAPAPPPPPPGHSPAAP